VLARSGGGECPCAAGSIGVLRVARVAAFGVDGKVRTFEAPVRAALDPELPIVIVVRVTFACVCVCVLRLSK